ncbi:MFS transporter [Tsukamurella serpentis]
MCDPRRIGRLHPAWRMVAVAASALLAAGSFTTIAGLITDPLIAEERWSRTEIGFGVALNMMLYGATAPFAAAVMDRVGARRVVAGALTLIATAAVLLVTFAPSARWFILWWGLLVGAGTGSVTMVFGASVAQRWFRTHVGLATGILTAASVAGQFVMLPLLSWVMAATSWRGPLVVCGALAALAALLVVLVLHNDPREIDSAAYGDADPAPVVAGEPIREPSLTRSIRVLRVSGTDLRFQTLAVMFLLCGATTNGLMWSHFTPAATDSGMTATAASTLLAIIGIANVPGTICAGWLSDRADPRIVLAVFFLTRGIALILLPMIFGSVVTPNLIVFAVVFGILDVATVPPTLALCRSYFGAESTLCFGWINVAHQLGAGGMALTGGLLREYTGGYTVVWVFGAHLCVCAAILGILAGRRACPRPSSSPAAGR